MRYNTRDLLQLTTYAALMFGAASQNFWRSPRSSFSYPLLPIIGIGFCISLTQWPHFKQRGRIGRRILEFPNHSYWGNSALWLNIGLQPLLIGLVSAVEGKSAAIALAVIAMTAAIVGRLLTKSVLLGEQGVFAQVFANWSPQKVELQTNAAQDRLILHDSWSFPVPENMRQQVRDVCQQKLSAAERSFPVHRLEFPIERED